MMSAKYTHKLRIVKDNTYYQYNNIVATTSAKYYCSQEAYMYNKMIIVRNTKSTLEIHLILNGKRQEKGKKHHYQQKKWPATWKIKHYN